MTRDQLTRYAAAAWSGINGDRQTSFSVRPKPGMTIVLCRHESSIYLRALQEEHQIDLADACVIAEAFGAPLEAVPVRSQRSAKQRVSGRTITEHVVTWSWLEI
jgi:hypothetical protein